MTYDLWHSLPPRYPAHRGAERPLGLDGDLSRLCSGVHERSTDVPVIALDSGTVQPHL
jgi:hypothetical protein